MALKSILQVPSLADRLTHARVERFEPTGANFQNCVITGLVPLTNLTPSVTNTKVSAGKAIVGGTVFDVAETTPTFTSDVLNLIWIDDAGAVQVGTAWPGAGNFAKVAGVLAVSTSIKKIDFSMGYRDWKLGYAPARKALVAPAPASPESRTNIYVYANDYSQENGRKFCQHGYFGKAAVIDELTCKLDACVVSGTDNCIAARMGFMEADEETWIEGAYKDIALTNGAGSRTFTFDTPWLPTMQKEYVLCLELTEYGPSFIYTQFALNGATQNQVDPDGWLVDRTYGGVHIFRYNYQDWVWETMCPYWAIRGYNAEGAYAQVTAEELSEAPDTFQAVINKRSNNAGVYGAIDPATQLVKAEASLDGGVHWHEFAEGEDIGTPYTGTDLIFRITAGNNNAADIEVDSAGFAYEV